MRRGVFRNVPQPERSIRDYLDHHNADPKPFQWTADADTILGRVARLCQRINGTEH